MPNRIPTAAADPWAAATIVAVAVVQQSSGGMAGVVGLVVVADAAVAAGDADP
jgi:hypothetical protein